MARVEGFEPANSDQVPVDANGNPVAVGVWGDSTTGVGVFGTSGALPPNVANIPTNIAGVEGHSIQNPGVFGRSIEGEGVAGESLQSLGMLGRSATGTGVLGVTFVPTPDASGVFGSSTTGGNGVTGFVGEATGVVGSSIRGTGVRGTSGDGDGVLGERFGVPTGGFEAGVRGLCDAGFGVVGSSNSLVGVFGLAGTERTRGIGVAGAAVNTGTGVSGVAGEGTGVRGDSASGSGVSGNSHGGFFSAGVSGDSSGGFISVGVWGTSSAQRGIGVYGRGGEDGWAAFLDGKVEVFGPLIKSGGGFRIDHPLEPAHKYLAHSFVESAEMKNVYDGVAALDGNGECFVELPEWFEALNCDFRYQLTSIGEPAPNLHVAREISNNRFNIAGGKSGMKVSWQVTGIRKDSWAQAHPLIVEEEKPADEQGYYRHPESYNQPPENSTFWKGNSELMLQLAAQQEGLFSKEIDQLRAKQMASPEEPSKIDRARLEEEWRRVEELVQRMGQPTLSKDSE